MTSDRVTRRIEGLALIAAGLVAVRAVAGPGAPSAAPPAWSWEKTPVPQALVADGLWGESFRVDAALDKAGIRRRSELKDLPRCAVVVLVNRPAARFLPGALDQVREFVSQGGGLVVLGGLNAYANGEYGGTPLEELLPVTLKDSYVDHFPSDPKGASLSRAEQADWPLAVDFGPAPRAWYFHGLVPKDGARVQVRVGDRPALVSGAFGKGRVVACALTVNGDPQGDVLPFWDWKDWPAVLALALDWAAGARPAGTVVAPSPSGAKPLTDKELSALESGLGEPPRDAVARALATPGERAATLLFGLVVPENEPARCGSNTVLKALVPYARPEWIPRLKPLADALNPNVETRGAALVLLGACRDAGSYPALVQALKDPRTELAAMDGLGRLGKAEAIPVLRARFEAVLAPARLPGGADRWKPEEFAAASPPAAHAAVALYRLGDPDGVARLCSLAGNLNLYRRIMANAANRWPRDPQGQKILEGILESRRKLQAAWEFVANDAGPIPASQGEAFVAAALTADDPVIVEWLAGALEASAGQLPAADWPSLAAARSGVLARMGKACRPGGVGDR